MAHLARIIIIALLYISTSSQSSAQSIGDSRVYSRLLQSLQYADIFRLKIGETCAANSSIANSRLRTLCTDISSLPDKVINQAAEPQIRKYVSLEEARRALAFWSSPEGAGISRNIVAYMRGRAEDLTPSEVTALQRANRSSYGIALNRFANDRNASTAIIYEVAANAP